MSDRRADRPPEDRESIPFLLARVSAMPLRAALAGRFADPLPRAVLDWQEPAARSRRIGGVALVVAAMLFLVAIFADLLASDAPLVCRAHGTVYVLPDVTHVPLEDVTWSIRTPIPHGPHASAATPSSRLRSAIRWGATVKAGTCSRAPSTGRGAICSSPLAQ